MVNKKSVYGRAVLIVILSFVILAISIASSYLVSGRIYDLYLTENTNKITQWKFITGKTALDVQNKDGVWKYSNAIFQIQKPIEDKYIRLNTTLSQKLDTPVLLIFTQSDSVHVFLDAIEIQGNTNGKSFTRTMILTIPLPDYYVGKTLEITANTSMVFEIKAGITQQARIDLINSYTYQPMIAVCLILMLLGILILILFSILSIKLRGVGRVILSGILLAGTGAALLLTELLPFAVETSNMLYYKSQFIVLMIIIPLVFGITFYTANRKKILPKVFLAIMFLLVFAFLILDNASHISVFLIGYAIFILIMSFSFLFFTKNLLLQNEFKNKFLYFASFFFGISIAFDFANSSLGIVPLNNGFFLFALLLYFISLTNLTIAKAINVNVRIKEREEQIKSNKKWIERIVSACANIFAKQQIEDYCIQTAISIKDLILDDMVENKSPSLLENNDGSVQSDVSVSVAIKKDGQFIEIHNVGSIRDCKYKLLEEMHSGNNKEGVFFGRSYMVILLYISNVLNAIVYFEGINNGISDNLKNIIMIAYNNISIAFDNLKLKSDIVQTQQSVFIYLAEMSEAKSIETGSHIKRVAEYVRTLCEAFGMSLHETQVVTKASMMHDIGKLAIPEELIVKKGEITPEEYEIIKQHVVYGHTMLSKSHGEFMEAAAVIAQQHHEKWDGSGYLGLKGEQIHLYARITSIADVYDALTNKRSYKDAWTSQEASGYIMENSGSHFDPLVVDAFIRSIDRIIAVQNVIVD